MRAADKNNPILVAERKEGPCGLKWFRKAFRKRQHRGWGPGVGKGYRRSDKMEWGGEQR